MAYESFAGLSTQGLLSDAVCSRSHLKGDRLEGLAALADGNPVQLQAILAVTSSRASAGSRSTSRNVAFVNFSTTRDAATARVTPNIGGATVGSEIYTTTVAVVTVAAVATPAPFTGAIWPPSLGGGAQAEGIGVHSCPWQIMWRTFHRNRPCREDRVVDVTRNTSQLVQRQKENA